MAESAKRHEENSNISKEIQASTDAAIRNQGATIKTLEIKIGQMSRVLQEIGIGGQPGSTEPNLRDHVKLISTAKSNSSAIHLDCMVTTVMIGRRHVKFRFWKLMITSCLRKKKTQGALLYLVLFMIFVLIKPLLT
ncbi:hypothetical protein Tco_1273656 [Tanacetum coccineum]